ncbi:DUF309 domain-containing protein [Staphylococcus felis]|uniref:DUF309 domain-containing protein n=1 Tax=Staphylococcus felis TaxID=46127 RepID=UPI0030B9DE7E
MIYLEKDLVEFYYHFHNEQHYFLCHDILEEAWKSEPKFTKRDPIVSLILLATGCYHYRRENYKGAKRSFQKALNIVLVCSSAQISMLGIIGEDYVETLKGLIFKSEHLYPFTPVAIPLTPIMITNIKRYYPDYRITPYVVESNIIKNHHIYRDRTEVIKARAIAMNQRKKKRE